MHPLWKGKAAALLLTVWGVLLMCRRECAESTNWGGFQFPNSEMNVSSEDVIAVMRMEKSHDSKQLSSPLFSVPYSISWAAVAFTLFYRAVTAQGHRFCVERALVCPLFFFLFHISIWEFQLLVSSCSNMHLGLLWRAFLVTHTPLYALVQCGCPVGMSVKHAPEGHNQPCTDGQLFA